MQAVVDSARTASTLRAYRRDWQTFTEWLDAHGHPHPRDSTPYPVEILASYLVGLAQGGYSISTIDRHLATICVVFEKLSIVNPRSKLEDTLAGLRRQLGVAADRKAPITKEVMAQMLAVTPPTTLENVLDRAVLLFGVVTALRRSDIAKTTWEELSFVSRGIEFRTKRKMKTDQAGDWFVLGLGRVDSEPLLCPVRALQHWRHEVEKRRGQVGDGRGRNLSPHTPLDSQPVFWRVRDGQLAVPFAPDGRDVYALVKKIALRAGLDPKRFAGHSLRAGFVTAGVEAGLTDDVLMRHTRHTQVDTLQIYKRDMGQHFDVAEKLLGRPK